MFYIGERVLCIDSRWGCTETGGFFQRTACPNLPSVGGIYTIRWCGVCGTDDTAYVRVVEIVNPINPNTGNEPVFQAKQFVPLKKDSAHHDILAWAGVSKKQRIRKEKQDH